jgi:phosphonate degradation associated HDIG domain protein
MTVRSQEHTMNPIEEIATVLSQAGQERYGEQNVNQLQHALQCAAHAEAVGSSADLITAALLHDIGHLIDKHFDGAVEAGIDRRHERIGAAYLSKWFGPAVTEPILLHVPAKRYLCAVESKYFDGLSAGSVRSLEVQGGPFSGTEAADFLKQPHARKAIHLRRWDDLAKDPDARTEDLDYYLGFAQRALKSGEAA